MKSGKLYLVIFSTFFVRIILFLRSWEATLAFRKGATNLLGVKNLGSEAGQLFLLLSGGQGKRENKWHKKDSWGHRSVGSIKKPEL